MSESLLPSRRVYAGLFVLTLSTLMLEILLTRIFSVTMWYHFAFMALSTAMFGMSVGALVVYLAPQWFTPERVHRQLAVIGVLFPVAIVFSFLVQLSIPFFIHPSIVAMFAIVLTFAVISIPFIVSGVGVCLALTKFPRHVSQLYAVDLAGAALGCVLLVGVLRITDGPTGMLVIATLASVAGMCFAWEAGDRLLKRGAALCTVLLALAAGAHMVLVWKQFPVFRILYAKGAFEARPLYERWNSYSRVRVTGDPNKPSRPYARTQSPTFPEDKLVRHLQLSIDVNATTEMLAFSGNLNDVEHLKFDVTNVAYQVRPLREVLVIGAGGGRDVLSALSFNAQRVTAVELNRDIIETVNGRYGDFTGHLDRRPEVQFVNDEARSFLARSTSRYDLIQMSLIDTWAATAAGAFVLSENSVYTTEAWQLFLERLSDNGVLSVVRWYPVTRPWEVYRSISLASAALRAVGVTDPRQHLAVVRTRPLGDGDTAIGVGSLLVSRRPFSESDLANLDATAKRLEFEVMLTPRVAADENLGQLASGGGGSRELVDLGVNLDPPTDNSPFFFNMLRLRDIFRWDLLAAGKSSPNMIAVLVLGSSLALVIAFCALCLAVPLYLTADRRALLGSRELLFYFGAIGLGFMLVEHSQMQRLIIVLGHPVYGLAVVLFALLLSSGLGSLLTSNLDPARISKSGATTLAVLVGALLLVGLVTPAITRMSEGSSTPVRILVATALLFPPGFLMGMAFPLGMKLAGARASSLGPWLWGINGALSVGASVLSVAIALTFGISAAYWAGCLAYLFAWFTFRQAGKTAVQVAVAPTRVSALRTP